MTDSTPSTATTVVPRSAHARQLSTSFVLIFAAVSLLLLGGLVFAVDRIGIASRSGANLGSTPTRVATVSSADELLDAWEAAGIRGLVLVQATSALGFRGDPLMGARAMNSAYPLDVPAARDAYRESARRENRDYVAANMGTFRTIYQLMSEKDFQDRVAQGRQAGMPGIAADGRSVTVNLEGFIRVIAPTAPTIDEPVVLDVDASYFVNGTAQSLFEQLSEASYSYAMVTCNLASDDASVTAEMRSQLREFESLFSKELSR